VKYIYVSHKGGKPLNVGMNQAKRIARRADRRDQVAVQKELGAGLPQQIAHHQELVRQRHGHYADRYEETQHVTKI
jgi:hypothetical protein